MTLPLTPRDEQIVLALTHKVRLFTLRQIATQWWEGELANARRRLNQLRSAGLIERIEVTVRTLPPLIRPVATWRPGEPLLNFQAVAYQLQSRWRMQAVRRLTAFIATEHATRIYGGRNRGELKHPLQATHDQGAAQVWLTLLNTAPAWAAAWRGEDLLAGTRRGEKCPDAFIVNEQEQVVCALEFGGQYAAERVAEFHYDCAARNLPYHLW